MQRRASGRRSLLPWQKLLTWFVAVVVVVDVEMRGSWRGQMGGWAFVVGIGVALQHWKLG